MTIKFTFYLLFSFIVGVYSVNAQQSRSNSDGPPPSEVAKRKNISKRSGKNHIKNTVIQKEGNANASTNLNSKSELEARAITARKTKNSPKRNISPEEAKRQREARIQAIIEKNRNKKFTQSKRKN